MQLIGHPAAIWMRRILRATGFAGPIRRLLTGNGYEKEVDAALLAVIRPGDVVWDVGANVGHYTRKMAQRVGSVGKVFAFEPSPMNFERLRIACSDLRNVECLPVGLSKAAGTILFYQGGDELGATSRLVRDHEDADVSITVNVCRGDDLVARSVVRAPNVIKIDVEGHELEVLKGLVGTLSGLTVRDCVIEVHFDLLTQLGSQYAAVDISRILKAAGFQLRWLDASHLHGTRAEC